VCYLEEGRGGVTDFSPLIPVEYCSIPAVSNFISFESYFLKIKVADT